jgi:uncharacterized protein (TIGR02147 family)
VLLTIDPVNLILVKKNDVFDFDDYKAYLENYVRRLPSQGHGFRSRMAEACGCRVAYVSQVLNGDLHFSLEQAEGLNSLLGHSAEESDFFLLLIQFGRAGTPALRTRIQDQMNRLLQKRLVLKDRVDIKTELDPVAQATYYSSWHYAAIHVLSTIENYRTREAMAAELRVPLERVSEVVEFLRSVGLLRSEKGRLYPGISRIFLGNDSPMIARHHSNWRIRAIESFDRNLNSDVHLSTLVSISKTDVLRIKEQVVKGIERTREMARESVPEETLYCFCVDFFKV